MISGKEDAAAQAFRSVALLVSTFWAIHGFTSVRIGRFAAHLQRKCGFGVQKLIIAV